MSSLSAHLRLPDDHSGLPFHASCPICRQDRLAGSLDGDEIVSRRTQAAIAAGLLAFSGVGAPAAATAAEPDIEIDGSAEVVEGPDPDDVALEETTIGWTDGGAAPLDDEEPAPVLETDDGMMEAAASEPVEEPVIEAADDEPAAEVEPAPEPVAVIAPPADAPPATAETPDPATAHGVRVDSADRTKRERPVERPKPAESRVIVAPAPAVSPVTSTAVTVRVAAGTNQNTVVRVSRGNRFHTVQRGESLWSIASDALGDGASVAEVAREVGRLWELNAERIGTGSPDVVYAGTRLRLR